MSEGVRRREPGTVLHAVPTEPPGAERYRRKQRQARSGGSAAPDRAHPLEFDERGFPVAQRSASFVERVARLLNPL